MRIAAKQCTKCVEWKKPEEFNKNGARGLHSHCLACKRKAYKEKYANPEERDRLRERDRGQRRKARGFIRTLKNHPCTDCNKRYPYYVMQFDHLGDKEYDVSRLVSTGATLLKIQQEVDKCELVCANCHAKRTFDRRLDKAEVV